MRLESLASCARSAGSDSAESAVTLAALAAEWTDGVREARMRSAGAEKSELGDERRGIMISARERMEEFLLHHTIIWKCWNHLERKEQEDAPFWRRWKDRQKYRICGTTLTFLPVFIFGVLTHFAESVKSQFFFDASSKRRSSEEDALKRKRSGSSVG